MGFVDSVKYVFANYANFNGRAARSEYWYFVLFMVIVMIGLSVLAGILSIFSYVLLAFYLAILIPSIAVAVRRMHDTDKSGWLVLLSLIPLVGLIVLYWFCLRGTVGPNNFGEDPLG